MYDGRYKMQDCKNDGPSSITGKMAGAASVRDCLSSGPIVYVALLFGSPSSSNPAFSASCAQITAALAY